MLFITSKIWCFLHRLWDLQGCYLLLGKRPHTEAAQVACCGLRTCCIGWGRIPAGLSKKSTVSVIWSNEVWCCIRRSLPWTLQICGTKKDIFFWQRSELWIWLNSAQHGKYMLCSTFWLDRPLLWSARLSSLLAQRWVQGAKHTILLQKPKPGLHQLRDEGQQNGYTEMILSSSESGHWALESHPLCWRK